MEDLFRNHSYSMFKFYAVHSSKLERSKSLELSVQSFVNCIQLTSPSPRQALSFSKVFQAETLYFWILTLLFFSLWKKHFLLQGGANVSVGEPCYQPKTLLDITGLHPGCPGLSFLQQKIPHKSGRVAENDSSSCSELDQYAKTAFDTARDMLHISQLLE